MMYLFLTVVLLNFFFFLIHGPLPSKSILASPITFLPPPPLTAHTQTELYYNYMCDMKDNKINIF